MPSHARRITLVGNNGASQEAIVMQPIDVSTQGLFDPTTVYLLFVLGVFAVFVELAHPGAVVPGAIGLVSLGIATAAFTTLPINPYGVVLIVASVGLME